MQAQEITTLIQQSIPTSNVEVKSDDGHHFQALVVSSAFEGLNLVKRQQLVYKSLGDLISSGKLHALALQTLTTAEWRARQQK
jgi:acid stress-induced BolA-like protein IbaG/YrbA